MLDIGLSDDRKGMMLMSRFRLAVCGAVPIAVVLAASIWGSAPASAAACEVKETKWVLCSGGNVVVVAVVEGPNKEMVLKGTLAGVAVEVKCGERKAGFIESGWGESEFTVKFAFEGCKVEKPAGQGCAIPANTILTEPVGGPLEQVGAAIEAKFEGLPTFAAIKFEKCANMALNNTFAMTGSQKCQALGEFTKEAAEHEFECKAAAGKLKLGGNAATLSLKMSMKLFKVAAWSIRLN